MADPRKSKRARTPTKLGVVDPAGTAARRTLVDPPRPRKRTRPVGEDLVGQVVLDRYLVDAELGSGAMGTVYRGHHIKLARNVAIKVLHPDFVHDRTMVARFRREAKAAGRLHHPNVSGVLDIGATPGGHLLMVMDLVDGRNLGELMETRLPRHRIINFVRQILQGLDHAHAAGLVHRDLKPDNVIVELDRSGNEVPRIVDFGIAVLRTDQAVDGGRLTETGTLLGTPLYISPEQARGDPVDHRADLFALGVMLFEMLTGTTPFEGNAIEIVVANMNEDIPAIAVRAPHAPAELLLERFLRRLAARDPAQRFATAHDALTVLDLIEHDPAEAALALGVIDVARALAVISLPG